MYFGGVGPRAFFRGSAIERSVKNLKERTEVITFEKWPKTPRLSRANTSITEKIDGTNAAVIIQPVDIESPLFVPDTAAKVVQFRNSWWAVGAQSRTRLIHPGSDNYGFARWTWDHAETLVDLLGSGRHFGEWWGQGIQRRYDMDRKVFSLFNTHRWGKVSQERLDWRDIARGINMTTVPLLYVGKFSDAQVEAALNLLKEVGSFASPEWGFTFRHPEGVVVYHSEFNANMKAMIENDDIPKSLQEGNE